MLKLQSLNLLDIDYWFLGTLHKVAPSLYQTICEAGEGLIDLLLDLLGVFEILCIFQGRVFHYIHQDMFALNICQMQWTRNLENYIPCIFYILLLQKDTQYFVGYGLQKIDRENLNFLSQILFS